MTQSNAQPNVIWFVCDHLRAQSLGCTGDPNVTTPNIDRLAAMGVTFRGAVSTSPICSPFRACMLTGRYPHQNGVPINGCRMKGPTIATVLGQGGYHTAWFGKWHVDAPHLGATAQTPKAGLEYVIPRQRRGNFETWIGYENLMNPHDGWLYGHDESGREIEPYRMGKYDTDALADLMVDYVHRRAEELASPAGKPFFAGLSCFAPHDPYVAPAQWLGRYAPGKIVLRKNVPDIERIQRQARLDAAGYCAMVENIDWNLGRILEALTDTGLAQRTHVLFFSDHGDMLGSHGLQRKSVPFEEAMRIPFIIGGEVSRWSDWDGRGNGACDAPISGVDVAPTTLGLCGLSVPDWMAGADFSGRRITGRPVPDIDSAYFGMWTPIMWDGIDRPWRGIVTRDGWKLVCLEHQPLMMFDLNEDPYETVNLVYTAVHADRRRQLVGRMRQWCRQTGDSFPFPSH